MTPAEALEIIDQMRLQVTATGAAHEQIREALDVLAKAVNGTTPSKAEEAR